MKDILFLSGGMAASQNIFETLIMYLNTYPKCQEKLQTARGGAYFFQWQISICSFGHTSL